MSAVVAAAHTHTTLNIRQTRPSQQGNLYPSSNPAHVWQRTDAARFTGVRFLGLIEPDLVAKPRYFLTPCSVVVASPCAGSSGYGRPSGDDLLTFGYILWYDNTCKYITDFSGGRRTPEGRRTPNRTLCVVRRPVPPVREKNSRLQHQGTAFGPCEARRNWRRAQAPPAIPFCVCAIR